MNIKKNEAYSKDQKKVVSLLNDPKTNKKTILMVAPSFVVDFDYRNFVPLMRGLGFGAVTELTFGAKIVNQNYHDFIKKKQGKGKFISSVCPLSVNLVKTKYPELKKFLLPFDSPMIAMAKVLKKNYPKHKIIFASPCFAKKEEAKEFNKKNKKELISAVITFSELKEILNNEKVSLEGLNTFDSFYNEYTKIYPLSGGLAKTLHSKGILDKEKIVSMDGCQNLTTLFDSHSDKVFFDILFCPGGCIGGAGIDSKMPIFWKKGKVLNYKKAASRIKEGEKVGLEKYTKGISFSKKI